MPRTILTMYLEQLLKSFASWCLHHFYRTKDKEFKTTNIKRLLTQVKVCRCPVAVQFRGKIFIFAVHSNSFRVEENGTVEIVPVVFIVTLILVNLCNCYNKAIGNNFRQTFKIKVASVNFFVLYFQMFQCCRNNNLSGSFENDLRSRFFSKLAQTSATYWTFKNCNKKIGSPWLFSPYVTVILSVCS